MFSSGSSSSSSSMVKATRYDVFLSFRGEDTRLGFVSHLYKDLKREKIETFIDDVKLPRGEGISETLLKAIEESRGSVIVFSKNYASSTWCLDELVKIMHCNNLNPKQYFVLPVFYCVDPSEVRKQTGSFSDAFAKHEENFKHDVEKVQTWRSALMEAASLSGWDSQVTRPESTLIDEIVKDIVKKLNHGTSSGYLEGLVGIERRMEQVMSLFQIRIPDFRKIGIWGMAGIGKTTLADAVFNHVSNGFESSYFLRNVRESEERGTILELRQKFLSAILEDGDLSISAPTIGTGFLKDRLSRKMILVVCDDVTNSSQLEFLFRGIDRFGPGSRVIITTRDKQVLIQNDIDLIYEVEELDKVESVQLFCQRAFKSNHHPKGYQLELSKEVLSFSNGNPLAIKVFGSSLYGKNKSYQESAVRKLKQIPNPDIHKLLRSSFDGLDCEEKDMFLDIAFFFKGEDRPFVTRIMDACYFSAHSGLDNLIDKSLISVSENKIAMHDLLQQMGWDIVWNESPSEPERRSRLWNPDDIYDVLTENTGTKTLKGMVLDMSRIPELQIKPEALVKIQKLKFLKFYLPNRFRSSQKKSKILLPGGLVSLPDELRYLCWMGYPLKTLPSQFDPRNLVELDMSHSNVELLWEGKQDLVNLKKISLEFSENLVRIPDLSNAKNLEDMNLYNCTNLIELHSSLENLEKLTRLDLRACECLRFLPSLNKATSLTKLFLCGCSNIFRFPEVSSNVRELGLEGTAIEQVPSSMESLCQLVVLSMNNCVRLKNFPAVPLNNLRSIEVLLLGGIPNITTFPEITGNIIELNLEETAIEEVPSSIGCLSNLRKLNLRRCSRLKSVSTSIHKLKSLVSFHLSGCSRLEIFPEILDTMETLVYLDLSRTGLKELPSSMENLIGLTDLKLNHCENLVYLRDSFYKMKSLEYLYLQGSSNLVKTLFSASGGASLTGRLEIQKHLQWLSSLFSLDLSGTNIENLATNIKELPKLKILNLWKCNRLKSLPELPPSLGSVDAHDCTSLEEVSSIKRLFEKALLCKRKLSFSWLFTNCFQMDEKSVRNPGIHKLQMLFQQMVTLLKDGQASPDRNIKLITCVPGSEIPQWFEFKTLGSSITIQLPTEWYTDSIQSFRGFIVSVVVSFQDYSDDTDVSIVCKCQLKSQGGGECHELNLFFSVWSMGIPFGARFLGSDHLFLLLDDKEIRRFVETQDSDKRVYSEASFTFYAETWDFLQFLSLEVKHCGIQPLFAQDKVQEPPPKRFKYDT